MTTQGVTLAQALVEASAAMPAVTPDKVNPHYGNAFVSFSHLVATTKPVLKAHDLAITQLVSNIDGHPALTTKLFHGPSDQAIESTMPLILAKQDMQGLGAAITYGKRQAWAGLLGISDEVDDDGENASKVAAASPAHAAAHAPAGETHTPSPAGAPLKNMERFAVPEGAKPISGEGGEWQWVSGKHQGTLLKNTPLEYVTWYAEKGPKQDVRQRCAQFLEPIGAGAGVDADIPFAPTIDGLGN